MFTIDEFEAVIEKIVERHVTQAMHHVMHHVTIRKMQDAQRARKYRRNKKRHKAQNAVKRDLGSSSGSPKNVSASSTKQNKGDRKRTRRSQMPEDFNPNSTTQYLAKQLGFSEHELRAEIATCRRHYQGRGFAMADWDAIMQNWLEKAAKMRSQTTQKKSFNEQVAELARKQKEQNDERQRCSAGQTVEVLSFVRDQSGTIPGAAGLNGGDHPRYSNGSAGSGGESVSVRADRPECA